MACGGRRRGRMKAVDRIKHDVIYLYVHGAAQPNPGPAGAGVVAQNEERELLFQIRQYLGKKTNHQAAYESLVIGLQHIESTGYIVHELVIRSDSELLVKQVTGEYKIADTKLKELRRQVDDLLTFQPFRIQRISKKDNAEAIRLSHEGITIIGADCGYKDPLVGG